MLDVTISTKKKYKLEFFEDIFCCLVKKFEVKLMIKVEDVRGLSQHCVERGDFT